MSSGQWNPGAPVSNHGVEGDEEFTGDSNQRDLLGLARCQQARPEGGQVGVAANRGSRRHIQRLAHACAAADDPAPSAETSAVAGHRRQTGQGGDLPSAELSQLRQLGQQGPRGLGPNAGRGAQLRGSLARAGLLAQKLL